MTVWYELICAEPDRVSVGTRLAKYPTLCQPASWQPMHASMCVPGIGFRSALIHVHEWKQPCCSA